MAEPFTWRWVYGGMAGALLALFIGPIFDPFADIAGDLSYPGCALYRGVHNIRFGEPSKLRALKHELESEFGNVNYRIEYDSYKFHIEEISIIEEEYNKRKKYCSELPIILAEGEVLELEERVRELEHLLFRVRPWTTEFIQNGRVASQEMYDKINGEHSDVIDKLLADRDNREHISDCRDNPPLLDENLINKHRQSRIEKEQEYPHLLDMRDKLASEIELVQEDLELSVRKYNDLPDVCFQFFEKY